MSEKRVFTPSPEQAAFLDWIVEGSGSCVLIAVAGAGKTTTLVEGVRRMTGTVFLGAYNNKMGAELKARLETIAVEELGSRLDGLDEKARRDAIWSHSKNKQASTFHSAGFKALCRANPKLKERRDSVDDKKVRDIVEKAVLGRREEFVEGFVPAVCQLVSLAKQTGFYCRGLVEKVELRYWMELVHRHDVADRLPDDFDPRALCEYADAALKTSNSMRDVIDFDDMVYLPLLLNLRFFRNDWVLIDEAQDTNAVRRELAARMLRPGGRMVAVGDPHQAIYGFTGADNRSLDLIRERFGAREFALSVSWRCPRSVVAVAREYVGHIRPADTAPDGVVGQETYTQMLANVAPGTALLCRFNAPLVDLCFRLIREGKPAKIEGRAIGEGFAALLGRWKVKTLDAFENRLTVWNDRERAKIEGAAKRDETKLEKHEDKYATILCLLERAREQGKTTVAEMQEMIRDMFADVAETPGASRLVILSSVHRSKGLEWPTVRVLGRGEVMPSRRPMQDWQAEQEINLCYVAVTRAKACLIDVRMPQPGELKPKGTVVQAKPAEEKA